ncbi:MAG: sodium:solute symporter [Flavobacteriales bacterium]|nr:sodium:solute symporter [Flavobacteriales bacterium]MCX7768763.1 sodium:solute symporter [Flavobacteriales bacterium]MDW8409443.1 sodium:solute symporter [Flavobacteriales bacterium]
MNTFDWFVLFLSQVLVVAYGIWRTRRTKSSLAFLKAGKTQGWFAVGLSVMATQASAITFLSGPGQSFAEGMGFLQFYLGVPLAMLVLIKIFLPVYEKLNITSAYEYLEARFGLAARLFTASLFLLQRGLAAGFTIFAPALVFAALLGWDVRLTSLLCGLAVVAYTVTGGSHAVAETHKLQMGIMLAGLFFSIYLLIHFLVPHTGTFNHLWTAAEATGRLRCLDWQPDFQTKYTLWSGLIGGFFVALSYFGTDQSQVSRYLGGRNLKEARKGLLMNALLKIPMQAIVLLCGVFLYLFYLYHPRPLHFNPVVEKKILFSTDPLIKQRLMAYERATDSLRSILKSRPFNAELVHRATQVSDSLGKAMRMTLEMALPSAELNDTNYPFLRFVIENFPAGALGLIVSMLFSAAMSSASSELNALATVSCVDFYKRLFKPSAGDSDLLRFGRIITTVWGAYAIAFAMNAGNLGTLIEAVNILGSLVYGTILGVFLTGFFIPRAHQSHVLWAAATAEAVVLYCFLADVMPFLWFNVVSALLVVGLSWLLSWISKTFKHFVIRD